MLYQLFPKDDETGLNVMLQHYLITGIEQCGIMNYHQELVKPIILVIHVINNMRE